mmetsp:Transcript_917/g.2192  ORF Transcript_917/g.2192 Transcript_917/m.2192 type:complete len:272 (+) Transcript_917:54-869(+)
MSSALACSRQIPRGCPDPFRPACRAPASAPWQGQRRGPSANPRSPIRCRRRPCLAVQGDPRRQGGQSRRLPPPPRGCGSASRRPRGCALSRGTRAPAKPLPEPGGRREDRRQGAPALDRVAQLPARGHLVVPARVPDRADAAALDEDAPEPGNLLVGGGSEHGPHVWVEYEQVYLCLDALKKFQQAASIVLGVVDAPQHEVLDENMPPRGARPVLAREERPQRRHQLVDRVSAVHWHDPVPNLVGGGMQGDRELRAALPAEALHLRDEANR